MRQRHRPTMKDVAALAGVSFKTVSRVVNDERGVAPAMAERVRSAIVELGYQPDHRARNLRSRGRGPATIGFIHADIANPFFGSVHTAVEAVATEKGCLILTGTSGEDQARQEALVEAFAGRRVDGLVIVPAGDSTTPASPALSAEIARGVPVVFIDREPASAAALAGDVVLSDHRGGAMLATEHLLGVGHRRIAFLGGHRYLHSAAERRDGFEAAMAAAGCEPVAVVSDLDGATAAGKTVRELLERPRPGRPTALFAAQNHLTIGAAKALHALGLEHEVALVGFDDFEMADLVEPAITVVPQQPDELGRAAAELLFSRLLDGRTETVRRVVPVSLVPRGSGEIPPH